MNETATSPQLEDGYLRIANELWEAFGKVNLTAYESRVINAVVRFTYGFQKPGDTISLSQFADYTGIDRRHVQRTLKSLVGRAILTRTGGGRGRGNVSFWALNKHYDQWDNSAQPGANVIKAPNEATITDNKGAPPGANSQKEKAPQTVIKGALDDPKRRHVRRPPKTSSKDISPKKEDILDDPTDLVIASREYEVAFGPIGGEVQWQQWIALWDEFPSIELHRDAIAAMQERHLRHPNLAYYSRVVETIFQRDYVREEE